MLTAKNTRPEDWKPIETVLEELRMNKKTFQNKESANKIPADAIRRGIKKMYHLPTLKGLTN